MFRGTPYRGTANFFLGPEGWGPSGASIHSAASGHPSPAGQKKILMELGERVTTWADGPGKPALLLTERQRLERALVEAQLELDRARAHFAARLEALNAFTAANPLA